MKRPLVSIGLVGLVAALLCGAASAPPAAALSFAPPMALGAGGQPYDVAVADFNNDGKTDVVTANSAADTVSVLLGDGTGGLTLAGPPIAVGDGPHDLAVEYFNGDAFVDLATANHINGPGGNSVSVLLGDGSGGFALQPVAPATGAGPYAIAVTDLNGDAKADLATTNAFSNNVTVLLGAGDGTFAAVAGSPYATGNAPYGIAVADFDKNGTPDVATADSGTVSVLPGNGDGTLGAAVAIAAPGPFDLAAADLDANGKPDLVMANAGTNTIGVMRNTVAVIGTPSFASQISYFGGSTMTMLAAADLNGDGRCDVVTGGSTTGLGNVTVLAGNGDGSLGWPVEFAAGFQPFGVAIADLNGGQPDLVVANNIAGANRVSVLLNTTKSKITSITPAKGKAGATVTITGTGFGTVRGAAKVLFGTKAATKYPFWSQTTIKVKVPAMAAGKKALTVKTVEGKSNAKSFKVL